MEVLIKKSDCSWCRISFLAEFLKIEVLLMATGYFLSELLNYKILVRVTVFFCRVFHYQNSHGGDSCFLSRFLQNNFLPRSILKKYLCKKLKVLQNQLLMKSIFICTHFSFGLRPCEHSGWWRPGVTETPIDSSGIYIFLSLSRVPDLRPGTPELGGSFTHIFPWNLSFHRDLQADI